MVNSKGKILLIVPTDEMGGAEQLIKMLATNYLAVAEKVDVFCLTRRRMNGWSDYPSKVNYFATSNVFVGCFCLLVKLFNKEYSIVFSSQVYINGALGFLRKFKCYKFSKLIVRESTSVFLRYKGLKLWTFKAFYNLGYANADLVICQTDLMKQQLVDNINAFKSFNLQVIDNPIDLKNTYIKAESINDDKFDKYIISVGRLIYAKGFDNLIKSFVMILKKYPELKLIILGEGPERENLEELISHYKLDGKVILPGYSNNPFPKIKGAEVCVVSSRVEGFPNTLLQMMALNDKVVCTKCAGGIEDIQAIHLCNNDNINELFEVIVNCLEDSVNSRNNRTYFDQYLSGRSIQNFMTKIEINC